MFGRKRHRGFVQEPFALERIQLQRDNPDLTSYLAGPFGDYAIGGGEQVRKRGRGHSKKPWNEEKELTRCLTGVSRQLRKTNNRQGLLSKRNLSKFRSVVQALNKSGFSSPTGWGLMSVLSDADLDDDAALEILEGGKYDDMTPSQVRSITTGDKGSIVTIPNTPTQISAPFRLLLAGPSQCGKTHFFKKFLRFREFMSVPPPKQVFWFYGVEASVEDAREEFPEITFIQDLPTDEWMRDKIDPEDYPLLIIDDLMQDAITPDRRASTKDSRKTINHLFTRGSHHQNISVIMTTQTLFSNVKMRELALNASATVVFANNRDRSHIRPLGDQIFGTGEKGGAFLVACMKYLEHYLEKEDLKGERPYLWISHQAGTSPGRQVRTKVFPGEDNIYFVRSRDVRTVDPKVVTQSEALE